MTQAQEILAPILPANELEEMLDLNSIESKTSKRSKKKMN
jgi:hypothetical protein